MLETASNADDEPLHADGDRGVVVLGPCRLVCRISRSVVGDHFKPMSTIVLPWTRPRPVPTVCSTIAAVIGVSVSVGTGDGLYA